jgi:hypothetical protein
MIKTRIRHKRDTLANWTNSNPILLNGEIVIVEDGDCALLKRGDGTKNFNQLPFIGSGVFATKTDLSTVEGSVKTYIDAHSTSTSNPHRVTKAQVGLGNVDNTADINKTVKKAGIADTATSATKATQDSSGNIITTTYATKSELSTMEGSVKTYIDAHSTNKSNPHGVTKAQLGLGNVDNTADSAKTVKAAGTATTATKATQDASGNVITTTYATKTELNDATGSAKTYADQKISAWRTVAAISALSDLSSKANGWYSLSSATIGGVSGAWTIAKIGTLYTATNMSDPRVMLNSVDLSNWYSPYAYWHA